MKIGAEPFRRYLAVYPLDVSPGTPLGAPLNSPMSGEIKALTLFAIIRSGRFYLKRRDTNRLVAGPVFLCAAPGTITEMHSDISTKGYAVVIDPALVSGLLSPFLEATGANDLISESGITAVPIDRTCAENSCRTMKRIKEEAEKKRAGWRETSVLLLGELLVEICRCDRPATGRISVEDLPEYLSAHYSESFTLPELARVCGTTEGALSRAFRNVAGQPLFSFINNIRIEKACGLLKRTDLTILEIAFAVGYNNVSFFNRYFRKLMGSSPGEYRKSAK